jgi:hypothetical protein
LHQLQKRQFANGLGQVSGKDRFNDAGRPAVLNSGRDASSLVAGFSGRIQLMLMVVIRRSIFRRNGRFRRWNTRNRKCRALLLGADNVGRSVIRRASDQVETPQPLHAADQLQRKPVASAPFVPEPLLDADQAGDHANPSEPHRARLFR